MSCYNHSHLLILYLAQILRFWVTCGVKMMSLCMVEADSHLKLLPTSKLDIYKMIDHIDMLSMGIQYQPYTIIPTLLGSDLGALGHLLSQYDVIMSWLRLTATSNCFHIHTRHIQSVWAHWYAVHCHRVAVLHSYTHSNRIRFWGSGSLVESKWCHYVMVEADSHLKLLPTSILDIYKMLEHIDMLSMGIQYQPYTVISSLLCSDFGALGHLWSQSDIIMSWLRLTAPSNCFPHPY
jgi:hypothetical protein